jgi:hypothetical protein
MPSLFIFLQVHNMKVEKHGRASAQKSCESEQNSLSYDFFKKRCSGAMTWYHHQHQHQNMFSQKNHNLISFAWIHMILVPTRPHFSLLSPDV